MTIETPLALSAGARIGSWGLRQTKSILDEITSPAQVLSSLQVFMYSPSGEIIAALSAGRGDGSLLNIKWNEEKIGGLKTFEIEMLKNIEIPFFTGMLTRFFIYNEPWALGYLKAIPDTDTDSDKIRLKGVGYSEKLKDRTITETYTNVTPSAIIADIGTKYFPDVEIGYNSTKIQVTNFNITKVVYDDKSLTEVFNNLLEILNFQFQNNQFIFGVDEYQDFYFRGMDRSINRSHIFEGYNYQSPEVEIDVDDIVNQVKVFRTQETSEKETEFVATYQDQDSIDNHGLFERKLTVSDFVSDDEAEKIADSIIEENKDPRKHIKIENYELFNHLDFGYYGLSNKRDFQRNVISEFSDLTQWTKTLTTSAITEQTTRVFSGRRCYNWSLNNSAGDKISLDFDTVYTPQKAVIYLRNSAVGTDLKITFNGISGKKHIQLVEENAVPITGDELKLIKISEDVTTSGLTTNLQAILINDWVKYEIEFENIFSVNSVEIEVLTASTVKILIDRLEIFSNSYKYNFLALEDAEYMIGPTSIKTSANFGNKEKTIVTELTEVDKRNKIPLNIFSKQ